MDEELETVLVSLDEAAGIGTVTMNRPDVLNALSAQHTRDIKSGLRRLESAAAESDGPDLRVAILSGAGDRAFSAGADITEFGDGGGGGSSARSHYRFIREFPVPVIAKIHGYCLGGGFETALSCDFRYASEESTFGFPEVDLGFLPGVGGGQLVSKIASPAVAKELVMTGKHVTAERAAREGLVHEVHPADDLDGAVRDFAEELAGQAPLAIRAIKQSINLSMAVGLEEGVEYDARTSSALTNTEDFAEGSAAFLEDREPEFEGR